MATKATATFQNTLDELNIAPSAQGAEFSAGLGMSHMCHQGSKGYDDQVASGKIITPETQQTQQHFQELLDKIGVTADPNQSIASAVSQNAIAAEVLNPMIRDVERISGKSSTQMSSKEFVDQMQNMIDLKVDAHEVKKMKGLGTDYQERFGKLQGNYPKIVAGNIETSLAKQKIKFDKSLVEVLNKLEADQELTQQLERNKEFDKQSEQARIRLTKQISGLTTTAAVVGASSNAPALLEGLRAMTATAEAPGMASMADLEKHLLSDKTEKKPKSLARDLEAAQLLEKLLDPETKQSPEIEQQFQSLIAPAKTPLTAEQASEKAQLLTKMIKELENPALETTVESKKLVDDLKTQLEATRQEVVAVQQIQEEKERENNEVVAPKVAAIVTHNPESPGCAELSNAVAVLYSGAETKGETQAKGETAIASTSAAAPIATGALSGDVIGAATHALNEAESNQTQFGSTSPSKSMSA